MDLVTVLPYIQVSLTIIMIILILLYRSDAGVGGVFGGSSSEATHTKKRGAEKVIFIATIVVSTLFVVSVLIDLFI